MVEGQATGQSETEGIRNSDFYAKKWKKIVKVSIKF